MLNRRDVLIGTAQAFTWAGSARCAFGADPWTEDEIIQPAELSKRMAGIAPLIVCVAFPRLYQQRHIRGAKFAGPGARPDGIKEIEAFAATVSKDAEVIIYCGCCPMKDCPNIRPAYDALKRLGLKKVRVLNIPSNLHNDWTTKDYPVEPPQTPRTGG
jgi:hypothetical protein